MNGPVALQNLNSDTYTITPSATIATKTLTATYGFAPYGYRAHIIVYNASDRAVFVGAGVNGAPAGFAFPTTGATKNGKIVPPGIAMTFAISPETTHISVIHAAGGGTGDVYFSIGLGV